MPVTGEAKSSGDHVGADGGSRKGSGSGPGLMASFEGPPGGRRTAVRVPRVPECRTYPRSPEALASGAKRFVCTLKGSEAMVVLLYLS